MATNASTAVAADQGKHVRPMPRPRLRRIIGVAAGVLLALMVLGYFGVSAYVADRLSRPEHKAVVSSPAQYGLTYQDVVFTSTVDNIPLSGWLIDYDVLMFDFRAHGKSGGERYAFGQWETRDVAGALNYLQRRGHTDISTYAVSMGAAISLTKLGDRPVYQVHSVEEDDWVPLDQAEEMEQMEQAGAHDANFVSWIAPGKGHVAAYTNNKEEYTSRMLQFYEQYLQ